MPVQCPLTSTLPTYGNDIDVNHGSREEGDCRGWMAQEAVGGLSNEGYWGIPVQAGRQYALSLYISSAQASPLRCHTPMSKKRVEVACGAMPKWYCSDAPSCYTDNASRSYAVVLHMLIEQRKSTGRWFRWRMRDAWRSWNRPNTERVDLDDCNRNRNTAWRLRRSSG